MSNLHTNEVNKVDPMVFFTIYRNLIPPPLFPYPAIQLGLEI